ncbi:MAG TPA: hypothetical protein DEP66_07365 [Acidimicrobiaceae bacterium]|nr:hypothetical protein [Acidimicrobiaceae bacterium]HCB37995.1 hypothetical protein [Acidimicrobiaceae bacterium]
MAPITITLPGGALAAADARRLVTTCVETRERREPAVVVVANEPGTDFCTGADFDPTDVVPDPAAALATVRGPTVCVVSGACASVGLEIALACDIRLCDGSARFSMSDPVAGRLPAWGGTQRLGRAVGVGRATAMLLLGVEVPAADAVAWGLVHQAADDLDAALADLLARLDAAAPLALEFAKEAVHRGAELGLADGLRLEGDLNHQLAATDDRAEGLAAFFDKRPPDFSGR